MKIKTLLLLFVLTLGLNANASAKVDDAIVYDIVSAGSGVQGSYLVKVWVYDRRGKVSENELKYAAVHGVLFRGFSAEKGKPGQRPLISDATVEKQKADYFQAFFKEDSGAYLQYASVVEGTYERVKTAKKGYKVAAVVQVMKDNLRKEMEKAGIIKSLSNGF